MSSFTMVGNGRAGLLPARSARHPIPSKIQVDAAAANRAANGATIIVDDRSQSSANIPYNPVYRQLIETQRRNSQIVPGPFPPGMTEQVAAELAIQRDTLVAMPTRVVQPPYAIQPASAQSFTYTDNTVSATTVTLPAVNAFGQVVRFKVPWGRNGVIDAIANQLTVGGFQDGSGNALWFLQINGITYKGFAGIKAAIGTMSNPGRYEGKKIRIFEGDEVELLIQNIALFAGQGIVQGLLAGYFYSIAEEFEAVYV